MCMLDTVQGEWEHHSRRLDSADPPCGGKQGLCGACSQSRLSRSDLSTTFLLMCHHALLHLADYFAAQV